MMDDFRRPLDGNSCPTLGCDPKISSGFSSIVSHLDLLRFLNGTSNQSAWPLDRLGLPSEESFCRIILHYSSVHWANFVTEEMRWRNAINREAIRFHTGLWSMGKERKNVCEASGLVLKMGCMSLKFRKATAAVMTEWFSGNAVSCIKRSTWKRQINTRNNMTLSINECRSTITHI